MPHSQFCSVLSPFWVNPIISDSSQPPSFFFHSIVFPSQSELCFSESVLKRPVTLHSSEEASFPKLCFVSWFLQEIFSGTCELSESDAPSLVWSLSTGWALLFVVYSPYPMEKWDLSEITLENAFCPQHCSLSSRVLVEPTHQIYTVAGGWHSSWPSSVDFHHMSPGTGGNLQCQLSDALTLGTGVAHKRVHSPACTSQGPLLSL